MIGNKFLQELFECPDEDTVINYGSKCKLVISSFKHFLQRFFSVDYLGYQFLFAAF